jgi:predicted TIM-barrel fold metal-dependent hydrolase
MTGVTAVRVMTYVVLEFYGNRYVFGTDWVICVCVTVVEL